MHDTLREMFDRSLLRFIEREAKNISSGVAERNLCARWAPLLEQEAIDAGLAEYCADPDYNRMQDGRVKAMLVDHIEVVSIVCDLILHRRGEQPERENLIAIEMKKSHRPQGEKDSDRACLKTLTLSSFDDVWSADGKTLPEYVCGYALGYYCEIDLKARTILIEEYVAGEQNGERVMSF